MKTCTVCEVEKPLEDFMRNGKAADGRSSRCMACVLEGLKTVRQRRRLEANARIEAAGGKSCHSCGKMKPREAFAPREASVDGMASNCRACTNRVKERRRSEPGFREREAEKARRHYRKYPEKLRARSKAYREANPEKARNANINAKAKLLTNDWTRVAMQSVNRLRMRNKFGLATIDAEYLRSLFEQQGGRCYWLRVTLVPSAIKRHPLRPSVDRLDNSRGYERGNVVIACQFANVDSFREFVTILRASMRTD
jgi:hypothetical protein